MTQEEQNIRTEQNIKVGDKVQLPGHFSEECWKTGIVSNIYEGYAWVRYGFPIYGISGAIDISELEGV